MKKIFFILSPLVILLSCRNEGSDDNPQNEISIIGTWKYSKEIVISGKDNSTVLFSESPTECEKKTYDVYTENGQYTEFLYQANFDGNCFLIKNEGTYTYNNDTKKLTQIIPQLGYSVTDDVVKLDINNLHIQYDVTSDYNNDGFPDKAILQYYR